MASFEVAQRALKEWPVYPGHPLVLAILIMESFPDFATAVVSGLHNWPAALTDSRIPGSGCHVNAAITVLAKGAKGASIDEMIDYARDYWERGQAGGHVKNVEPGREQADRYLGVFRERAAGWFSSR